MILVLTLILFGCNQNNVTRSEVKTQMDSLPNQQWDRTQEWTLNLQPYGAASDTGQVEQLIRKVLVWADSKNSINLLPMLTDKRDSFYIGFDLNKHNENLDKLRGTDFFANEFINNYDQIILTLDKKLRNKNFEPWMVGDLPTFPFANDVDPWCDCQDYLDWDSVVVQVIQINGNRWNLRWKWGNPEVAGDPGWREFYYDFTAIKENGKWRVAYMNGFDFHEGTGKDGL